MTQPRLKLLFAFNEWVRNQYLPAEELARLETFADWDWFPCQGGGIYDTNDDPEAAESLRQKVGDIDGLVLCHGAPTISKTIMDAAPKLRFIGEMESDRFAKRIDLETAWEKGIRVVDTTNGSSYPVAEWALGLILVATRNAGTHFSQLISGNTKANYDITRASFGMLAGKRVGLIGGGHMGRHLMKLLRPFEVDIWVHDPYLPREMAEAVGFTQTTLDNLFAHCDVVVCLAPQTPRTEKMISTRQFELMKPRSVYVSVSRGIVTDSAALIARLEKGDIYVALDVFDPEPIPPESPILTLPNVFLSPHIGWFNGAPHPYFFKLIVDELERFAQGHETFFDLTPRSLANRRGN